MRKGSDRATCFPGIAAPGSRYSFPCWRALRFSMACLAQEYRVTAACGYEEGLEEGTTMLPVRPQHTSSTNSTRAPLAKNPGRGGSRGQDLRQVHSQLPYPAAMLATVQGQTTETSAAVVRLRPCHRWTPEAPMMRGGLDSSRPVESAVGAMQALAHLSACLQSTSSRISLALGVRVTRPTHRTSLPRGAMGAGKMCAWARTRAQQQLLAMEAMLVHTGRRTGAKIDKGQLRGRGKTSGFPRKDTIPGVLILRRVGLTTQRSLAITDRQVEAGPGAVGEATE